jgi:hypothetical protein
MKLKQIILLFNLILFISSANLPSVELQQFIKLGSYKITHINDGGVLVKQRHYILNQQQIFGNKTKI